MKGKKGDNSIERGSPANGAGSWCSLAHAQTGQRSRKLEWHLPLGDTSPPNNFSSIDPGIDCRNQGEEEVGGPTESL